MLFSVASGMSDEMDADIHGVYEVFRLGILGQVYKHILNSTI